MNLQKEAKGRECQIRIPGVCNRDSKTTVLCHLHSVQGGGRFMKHDLLAAIGCSACHDIIDGRNIEKHMSFKTPLWLFLEAMTRTQELWINEGIIVI
jgi:hypothetical protein